MLKQTAEDSCMWKEDLTFIVSEVKKLNLAETM